MDQPGRLRAGKGPVAGTPRYALPVCPEAATRRRSALLGGYGREAPEPLCGAVRRPMAMPRPGVAGHPGGPPEARTAAARRYACHPGEAAPDAQADKVREAAWRAAFFRVWNRGTKEWRERVQAEI